MLITTAAYCVVGQGCGCNTFQFITVDTTATDTTFSINVTNSCTAPFYYAAFGFAAGVSASAPSTYTGDNYQWNVVTWNGTAAATLTTPQVTWLRFVSPVTGIYNVANQRMSSVVSNPPAPNWDVFNFTLQNFGSGSVLYVQGHAGPYWSTFQLQPQIASGVCTVSNISSVDFKAEACPDSCSGRAEGVCVNETCAEDKLAKITPVLINGKKTCFFNSTVQDTTPNYCICYNGFKLPNCGQLTPRRKALPISGGTIVLIVVVGLLLLGAVVVGGMKLYQMVLALLHPELKQADNDNNAPLTTVE